MLGSLYFSINAVLPIFIIVLIGWLLRYFKLLDVAFFDKAEKLVFRVSLPCLLFTEVAFSGTDESADLPLIAFCVCGILALFAVLMVTVPLIIKQNDRRGAFIQGVYRSNFAILGIPLAQNMFGDAGSAKIAVVMPFAIALFNSIAVIIFSIFAPEDKKEKPGKIALGILLNIVKNPLIIAVILALPFLIFGWTLPEFVSKSIGYVSNLALPLALMSMGANFTFSSLKGRVGLAITASLLKVIILPAVFVTIAAVLGFRDASLGVIFILFGSPSAVSAYIMSKSMGSDYTLTGQITLLTTVLSILSLFCGIFLLRSMGLI